MKNKRTPIRQSSDKPEGASERTPREAGRRTDAPPRGRGAQHEQPPGDAPATKPAPRRKPAPNMGGRAHRGAVARDGRPLAEAKPIRLQKVLAEAGESIARFFASERRHLCSK